MGPRILNTYLRSKLTLDLGSLYMGPSQNSIQFKSNNNGFHTKWIGPIPEISLLNTVRVNSVHVVYIYSIYSFYPNGIQTPLLLTILVLNFKEVQSTHSECF